MLLEIETAFGNARSYPQIYLFLLLPSPWLKHGSPVLACVPDALRMELSVRCILRDAENGHFPRETKCGLYAFAGSEASRERRAGSAFTGYNDGAHADALREVQQGWVSL